MFGSARGYRAPTAESASRPVCPVARITYATATDTDRLRPCWQNSATRRPAAACSSMKAIAVSTCSFRHSSA
eukprot:CAMPEP_0174830786 /NCGR_PEP_ID=MMETSP1114-20130205/2724_1 /TAXON_ID=312471 /ORGANISM="Neobodo designis, Strain CCAP 1951/1" /LENGTH=71 /DNA_ID=CAMNT_0016064593 /DNA_START=569 /DNA_END=781 /DNA_ORIENTATION=+